MDRKPSETRQIVLDCSLIGAIVPDAVSKRYDCKQNRTKLDNNIV